MTLVYHVKTTFNLEGFLTAARADGIKLSATEDDLTTNGYLTLSQNELAIHLYEASDEAHNIVRLAGSLASYEVPLDLRVAQYDA